MAYFQGQLNTPLLFVTATRQILFLSCFITINVLIHLFAVPVFDEGKYIHPTYAYAADGQRYWGVAKVLAERGVFEHEHSTEHFLPLIRGGPLPALFFALPIKLVGFVNATTYIVLFQCALLYGISLLSRNLIAPYGASKNLMQGLIIFNPNLVGIAHHAQSDILFSFLLVLLFVLVYKLFQNKTYSIGLVTFIGLIAGLVPLARPAGYPFVIILPIILIILLGCNNSGRFQPRNWVKLVITGFIIFAVSFATMVPWSFRNYLVLDSFSIAVDKLTPLRDNYYLLINNSIGGSDIAIMENIRSNLSNQFAVDSIGACCVNLHIPSTTPNFQLTQRLNCLNRVGDPKSFRISRNKFINTCESMLIKTYLTSFTDLPISVLFRGLSIAWFNTFFTGGASAITNHLGISQPDKRILFSNFYGINTYLEYFQQALRHPSYVIFFLLFTLFTLVCRLFGIVGIIVVIVQKRLILQTLFSILTIVTFTTLYLFIGVSRFRAPLEPLLMLFACIGFQKLRETKMPKIRLKK